MPGQQQQGWGPAPTGEQQPYADPYAPQTGQYPPDPYGGGQQTGQYPPDPYGQQQGPVDDPYGMWGGEQAWEDPNQVGPSRRRRKWPLVVLGTVTVVIALVVATSQFGLFGSDDSAGAVPLNTPVADGAAEFTVANVDCGQTELEGSGILAPEIFCVLHLTTTNTGQAELFVDVNAQQVFNQDDQQLTVNQEWLAVPTRSYSQPVPPGATVSGVVIYDATTGSTGSRVVLHSAPNSPGAEVSVTG